MAGKRIDLVGQKYGRLTVIGRGEDYISPKGARSIRWLCQCDCGKMRSVSGAKLRSGKTKSCGCYSREMVGARSKKYNRYEFCDEHIVGYTFKEEPFVIDREDYDTVKDICWYRNTDGYLVGGFNGTNVMMHRLIMNPCEDEFVDHANHRPEDNRRQNLRIVTKSTNAMNEITRKDNSSGFRGVSFHKPTGKWRAYITYKGVTRHLGLYDSKEEAVSARQAVEDSLFGEFSYSNSMALAEQNGYVEQLA